MHSSTLHVQEVMATFKNPGVAHSDLLSEITTPGSRLPEIARPLEGLLQAAEWDIAAEEGRVIPKQVAIYISNQKAEKQSHDNAYELQAKDF